MAFNINVKYGSDILSQSVNEKTHMVIGDNCVVWGLNLSKHSNNQVGIDRGVSSIQGAKIESTDYTYITIPDLSVTMWYIVMRYEHSKSEVSITAKTTPTLLSNDLLLGHVKVVNNVIGVVDSVADTMMITQLNNKFKDVEIEITTLKDGKADKVHYHSFDQILNKPQYYPVDINALKQTFELKGISKGITLGIDLNAPPYAPGAWHDIKTYGLWNQNGCKFYQATHSVTLDDPGIYVMELNFTWISTANSKTDTGFDIRILEDGGVQDSFRWYYNVNDHRNGCSFIYGGMNTLPRHNIEIRPQIRPIFDTGRMSTSFTGFWSIRKLCDLGPYEKSMPMQLKKPITGKTVEEVMINQRGDILGITLDKMFADFRMDLDYQVEYVDDKKSRIRVFSKEFLKKIKSTPVDYIVNESAKIYPVALKEQKERNQLSEDELLTILKQNKSSLVKILNEI